MTSAGNIHNDARFEQREGGRSSESPATPAIDGRQLIVVSNRQPYTHEFDESGLSVSRPTGGLTAGLDPVMQRTGGTWIAWGDGDGDGRVVDANNCVSVPPEDPSYTLKRVWLSENQIRDYYYGYSNQVLWPLCHSLPGNVRCKPDYWREYSRANEQFADAIAGHADDRPLVWLQDYHLSLAPRMVRRQLSEDALLMHFWHIPWPSWDTFRACPYGREVLRGLLGTDLLGFHVPRYCRNFLQCANAAFDDATVDYQAGTVAYEGSVTRVEAIPMGVPFDEISREAAEPSAVRRWASFRQKYGIAEDTAVAVGVDRLDYTKGIPHRLRALERLWETYPRRRGSFTYVQIGSESRSRIPAYQEVREDVAETVDRINRRFGTNSWQPIVYTTEHLSQKALHALYRHADVAIVSPLRDGMNLVAQEYLAAQVDGDGVLVLSDQAGVHDLIGEDVLSVRPLQTGQFAATIVEAFDMPVEERRRRMGRLRQQVSDNDLDAWLQRNLELVAPGRRFQDQRAHGNAR